MRGVLPAARSPRGTVRRSRKGAAGSAPARQRRLRPRAGSPLVGPCLHALPAAVDAARARCCRTGTRAGPHAGTPRRRLSLGECRAAGLGARAGLARRSRCGRRGRPACGAAPGPGTRGWGTGGTTFRRCGGRWDSVSHPRFPGAGALWPGPPSRRTPLRERWVRGSFGVSPEGPEELLDSCQPQAFRGGVSHAGRRRPCERVCRQADPGDRQ